MNIFKRELTIYLRSRLFFLLLPLVPLLFSIWIIFGLQSYSLNSFDLVAIYNLVPMLFAWIIPLLSYNFWQREEALGLSSILLNSSTPTFSIILVKYASSVLLFTLLSVTLLPIIVFMSTSAFVDFGQLFSIEMSLILFIIYSVALTNLLSLIIKRRVINTIVGVVILLLTSYGNPLIISFYSGLFEFKNLLLPLALAGLFIVISSIIIERRFYLKRVLMPLLFLVLSIFSPGYIDLTSLRSHTLTDYSRETIDSGGLSFEFEYYYSTELSLSSSLPKETMRLLEQFDTLNNADVSIFTDSDSGFSDGVRRYKPGSLDGGDLYNFLVVKQGDDYNVIPFIPYVETLEFEILKVIHYYLSGGLKHIGIYIGNEELTGDNFTALNTALSDHFTVDMLFPGDIIHDDLDALLVIGQYGINYTYTDEIGHYLSHGGNLIVADTGLPTGQNLNFRTTPILEALAACGIVVEPYLIGTRGETSDYDLTFITSPNRELKGNSIIDPFTGFIGIYTSPIQIKNGAFDYLLFSDKNGWLVDSTTGIEGTPEGEYPVAAYGEGHFSEAFTGYDSSAVNKLMVIGSAISFTDYAVEVGGENSYDFIIRSLYSMVGYKELMAVRHKFNWEKSFIKEKRDIDKVLLLLYPLLLLAIFNKIFVFIRVRSKG